MECFLHGNSVGVQQLQEHFYISAHDTVQNDIFPAALCVDRKIPIAFKCILEHLAVCAGEGAAVIVDHERLEEDAVFIIDFPERIQESDKFLLAFTARG